MTTIPDQPTPASDTPTTIEPPIGPSTVAETDPVTSGVDAVLDAGTYGAIREPRSVHRLPLDGEWHQISRKYVVVQLISTGAFLLLVLAIALAVSLLWHQVWIWIPAGIVLAVTLWTLAILPRQARAYGYQLRGDDLVFRRGILWQRIVAVPYGRMQLVDITHGPLDRGFGIAQLKLVTAAASTAVTIPGLDQAAAETLRDTLIAVAETRRTGL
ncbi:PH domain-containing protein [Microbacterium sp.]|uniref:PH domain-containing protein n=1 Tax=Microbacterium sp. TaxID=51671 RepID=UPI0025F5202F|nr:PH domain-containing protein [Microbacterium sp.]